MGCVSVCGRSPEVLSDLPLRNSLASPFEPFQRRGVTWVSTGAAEFGQKPHPQVTAGDGTSAQPVLSGGGPENQAPFLPSHSDGSVVCKPHSPAHFAQPVFSFEDQQRGSPGCSDTHSQGKQEWIEETRPPYAVALPCLAPAIC